MMVWSKQQSQQKDGAKYGLCVLGSGNVCEPQHVCLLCINMKRGRIETQR